MGLTANYAYLCDSCGRSPGRDEEVKAEAEAAKRGMFTDDFYDRELYGWLSMRPTHLNLDFGHNAIPTKTIVLCAQCWPKVLGTMGQYRKESA